MSKDPLLYVIHILECIKKIEDYIDGDPTLFFDDLKTQDAVIRNLQTLAEATPHLDASLKKRAPDLEWGKISGFRTILIHDYLGSLDTHLIWNIVEQYLPKLKKALLEHYKNPLPISF